MNDAHQNYRRFLETLTPETLERLGDFVSDDVRFADPFNDVRGVEAMSQVFRHMFDTVSEIRFSVHRIFGDSTVCMMEWRFEGRLQGTDWSFPGTSVIEFEEDGRVRSHVDYWDAGTNFYERLPVIGWLLGAIRRRIAIH